MIMLIVYLISVVICWITMVRIIYAGKNDEYFKVKHLILELLIGIFGGLVPIVNTFMSIIALCSIIQYVIDDDNKENWFNKPAFKK